MTATITVPDLPPAALRRAEEIVSGYANGRIKTTSLFYEFFGRPCLQLPPHIETAFEAARKAHALWSKAKVGDYREKSVRECRALLDEALRALVRRIDAKPLVLSAANAVMQGDITLTEGLGRVRLLAPGLLDEPQAIQRGAHPHCTREFWLEDLASCMELIQDLRSGMKAAAYYDGDAEDQRHDHAVNVLAGVVEHTSDGRPCGLCAVVVPSTQTEVAA